MTCHRESKVRVTFIFVLMLLALCLSGQSDMLKNDIRLKAILSESLERDELAKKRVVEYLKANLGEEVHQFSDGTLAILQDVVNGHSVYYAVDNAETAATVGVNQLRSSGSLGITVLGEGMSIGVWDGGFARDSHVELIEKITSGDGGAELSDHATHVIGIILARGINETAKGMGPLASGISFDFNNDGSEMAASAGSNQGLLLVSNHSYGEIVGWRFEHSIPHIESRRCCF